MKIIFIGYILLFLICQLSKAQWKGFHAPVEYPCTNNYYLLVKDINNDSFPDIITANVYTKNANNFGVNINDRTGHFQKEVLNSLRAGYSVWDFADLNNDGLSDMLTSYYWDNGIRVYMGNALGNFTEGNLLPTAVHGGVSMIYDTDDDGSLDLVSTSQGSGNPTRLHIFKGKGDGTFFPKNTYESPYTSARHINIKDINQDGLPDIILAASLNKIPVFIQNKDHSFTSGEIPVERGECLDNAIGDINNDGIEDIVYGSDGNLPAGSKDTIRISLGKGKGKFGPSFTTQELSSIKSPVHVRIADINKDKNLDIVTFDCFTNDLYYFIGNGDSTFAAPVKITLNHKINNLEVSDINMDSCPDIVTINQDSTFSVILNTAETTNTESVSLESMLKVYPNPFRESVSIELSLPVSAFVKIDILDVFGRKIYKLENKKLVDQIYRYYWSNVLSGIYLLSVTINEKQEIYKLIKY